jgi:hypothetical protein
MTALKIPLQTSSPSVLHQDLAMKFTTDLQALMARSFDLMIPEIGPTYATNIVLSVLAMGGISVSKAAGGPPGTFAAMVVATDNYIKKGEI